MFLVDTDLPGFEKGKLLKKIGRSSSDTSELFFNNVRLPTSAILSGEEGLNRGFQFMMHDLGRERLIIAVMCTAYLELAFEWTRDYVHQRKGIFLQMICKMMQRLSSKNLFSFFSKMFKNKESIRELNSTFLASFI